MFVVFERIECECDWIESLVAVCSSRESANRIIDSLGQEVQSAWFGSADRYFIREVVADTIIED